MRPLLPLATLGALLLSSGCMPATDSTRMSAPVDSAPVDSVAATPATVVAEDSGTAVAVAPGGGHIGPARRGVITAGDIDDSLNLAAFTRYVGRMSGQTGLPRLGLGAPVLVRLTGPDGSPAPGARYTLRRPGAAEPFHQGYAGPDGRIADFPQVLGAGALGSVEVRVFDSDGAEIARDTVATGQSATISLPEAASWQPDFLDLVVVIDTTGSMADEIAFLQRELIGITRAAARTAPGLSIRYGLVAYRDTGDDYVVQNYGFTPSAPAMAGWLRGLSAGGGGDYPEAAAAALKAGVGLDWRRGKGERLVLHVADAPPHAGDAGAYLRTAKAAAADGIQIFTLGASGVGDEAEYLMRQVSVASGGRYLFLTDDSGVGQSHAEPGISCYRVTRLSRLLTRVLATELSGRRQEASPGEILREVGSYVNGICRD